MRREEYEKEKRVRNGSKLRVGIVVSEFNGDITAPMLEGALAVLKESKVKDHNIDVIYVPGSFEIPFGCLTLLRQKKKPDTIIAIGCVVKGETDHDKYIAQTAASGIMDLQLTYGVPIAFGIITPNNLEQARARAEGKYNKGSEAAEAALDCALL